jgi:phage-related protein
MAANPIGLVITALALLVGGLIVAYNSSETFRGIVDKVFDAVKKVVDFLKPIGAGAFEGLKLAFGAVKTVITGMAGIVTDVLDAFKAVYNFLKPIAAGVFNGIKTAFALLDTPIALVKTALDGVKAIAEPIIGFLSKIKSGVFSAVSTAFRLLSIPVTAFATALRKAKELWDWFTSIGGGKSTPTVAIGPTTPGTGLPPGYRAASLNVAPMGVGSATSTRSALVVNVSAGLVSNPDQVGQQIIEAIQSAERRSGPVFAPA